VAHSWVDTRTFKKNLKIFEKDSKKIQRNKNKNKKNSKKPRSDTWQSLLMAVNDLNSVSKKGPN